MLRVRHVKQNVRSYVSSEAPTLFSFSVEVEAADPRSASNGSGSESPVAAACKNANREDGSLAARSRRPFMLCAASSSCAASGRVQSEYTTLPSWAEKARSSLTSFPNTCSLKLEPNEKAAYNCGWLLVLLSWRFASLGSTWASSAGSVSASGGTSRLTTTVTRPQRAGGV
jgi:hypothetical protein